MKNKSRATEQTAASAEVYHLLGILARVTRRIVDDAERGEKSRSGKKERKP